MFGCLREVVSLFDEDFDLFNRVPARLLQINWVSNTPAHAHTHTHTHTLRAEQKEGVRC